MCIIHLIMSPLPYMRRWAFGGRHPSGSHNKKMDEVTCIHYAGAKKWDYSDRRKKAPGRPAVADAIARLVLRMAEENPTWGYDRIQGALANLGHEISDTTVGSILRANGIEPAPVRLVMQRATCAAPETRPERPEVLLQSARDLEIGRVVDFHRDTVHSHGPGCCPSLVRAYCDPTTTWSHACWSRP